MNDSEDDFNAIMKSSLGNDAAWNDVIANQYMAEHAMEWLRAARAKTQADLSSRRDQWSARGDHGGRSPEWREYKAWRARAIGFLGLIDRRTIQLKEAFDTWSKERVGNEAQRYRDTIIVMARVMSRSSDPVVRQALREILIPHGIDGDVPIITVLRDLREKAISGIPSGASA